MAGRHGDAADGHQRRPLHAGHPGPVAPGTATPTGRHLLHRRDQRGLLGGDALSEIGVDPGEVGGVGQLVVEPGPHLLCERLLLGPGIGQRGDGGVGGLGRLLGLALGVLGALPFVVETLLGGAKLVEGVGLVARVHLEQGPLGRVLLGGVGLEAPHQVLVGRGDVGVDRERHDLGPQGGDVGGGGRHRRSARAASAVLTSTWCCASARAACWPLTFSSRAARAAATCCWSPWRAFDPGGDLGLAGPDLLALLPGALAGGARRRARRRGHQCERDEPGGEGHREAASGSGTGRAHFDL